MDPLAKLLFEDVNKVNTNIYVDPNSVDFKFS